MTWRDQLRAGSYRGAPFLIESAETTIGRRTVVHEYPLKESAYVEDLGRRAGRYSLELFVVGPDYFAARDALLRALQAPGVGTLIHPYLGSLTVMVAGDVSVRETTREGGMARFSATFVEAGFSALPITVTDTVEIVTIEANAAELVVAGDLEATVVAQSELLDETQAIVQAWFDQVVDSVTDAESALTTATSLVAQIAGTPSPDAVFNLIRMSSLCAYTWATSNIVLRRIQAANLVGLRDFFQRNLVVAATRVAAETQFSDSNQALSVRTALLEAFDSLLESTGVEGLPIADVVYERLQTLRTAIAKDLTKRAAKLPKIRVIEALEVQPALVHCWIHYADLTRDSEFLLRNRVRHPLFVGAGQLEVLDA